MVYTAKLSSVQFSSVRSLPASLGFWCFLSHPVIPHHSFVHSFESKGSISCASTCHVPGSVHATAHSDSHTPASLLARDLREV